MMGKCATACRMAKDGFLRAPARALPCTKVSSWTASGTAVESSSFRAARLSRASFKEVYCSASSACFDASFLGVR